MGNLQKAPYHNGHAIKMPGPKLSFHQFVEHAEIINGIIWFWIYFLGRRCKNRIASGFAKHGHVCFQRAWVF